MSLRVFSLGAFTLAIAGVVVFLFLREDGPSRSPLGGIASSDEERALVSAPSAEPGEEPRIAEREEVQLGGAGICGFVLLEDGRPAGAAIVALRGPRDSATLRVGEDGAFCFDGLRPGSHDLAASSGRMRSETVEGLLLDAGEELRDLALVLRGGTWVSGRVVDRRAGEGVAGARVLAHCAAGLGLSTAGSADDGSFTLQDLPPGRHVLSVEASGYLRGEMYLDLAGSRPVRGVTIVLDPVARIRGRVEDHRGRPVAGATVRAAPYRLRERPEAFHVEGEGASESSEDGSFEVESPAGLVSVHAVASGHGPGRRDGIEAAAGGVVEGISLRLGAAAGLLVEVVDADGRPAVGARVRAICEGDVLCGSGLTDGRGHVELGDLAGGRARLEATGAGRSGSARLAVDVTDGVRRRLTLALSADGVLTGIVVDERGRAISGAAISALGPSGAGLARAFSSEDGRFHVPVPADLRVDLRAEANGALGEIFGVRAGDDLRVVLKMPGAVEGFVTDDAGRPVTDFTVTVVSSEGEGAQGVWRRQRFAAERGDFLLTELPPGGYRLQAFGPGFAASDEATVRVWPNDLVGPVQLRVASAGAVRGRVVGPDGTPVSGARVATEPGRLHGLARWTGGPGSAVETDGSGAFLLEDVPAGSPRRVFAWHHQWSAGASRPVQVEAGSISGPVEVRLRPRRGPGREPEAFGGVGMTIREDADGSILVAEVFPGGPAFLAGLRGGDRLLAVDGAPAHSLGLHGSLAAIRGPVGSEVALMIERESGARVEVRMVRVELRM